MSPSRRRNSISPKVTRAQDLVVEVARLKEEAKRVAENLADTEGDLIALMQEHGIRRIIDPDTKTVGTLVAATRIVINEPQLKKALGVKLWDKITKRVVDKKVLEANIATGEVDPTIVARCSEEVPNKPYVKITTK